MFSSCSLSLVNHVSFSVTIWTICLPIQFCSRLFSLDCLPTSPLMLRCTGFSHCPGCQCYRSLLIIIDIGILSRLSVSSWSGIIFTWLIQTYTQYIYKQHILNTCDILKCRQIWDLYNHEVIVTAGIFGVSQVIVIYLNVIWTSDHYLL